MCRVGCRPLRLEPEVSVSREHATVCDPELGSVLRVAACQVSRPVPASQQRSKLKHAAGKDVLLLDIWCGGPDFCCLEVQVPAISINSKQR